MFRGARLSSLLFAACVLTSCAEEPAELLDSRPPVKTAPAVSAPAQPPAPEKVPAVAIDKFGKVDEPDFKASVQVPTRPAPNYDPVSKGSVIGVPQHKAWAVPIEDGVTGPSSGTALPNNDEPQTAVTAEEISPALATVIAREKNGAKPQDIQAALQNVISADPQSAAAHYRLGMAFIRDSKPEKGLPELELAISLQSKNPKYLCDYGIAALRAGWVEKAFAACQAAVHLSASNPRFNSALGDVHLAAGHAADAVESYRRAIAADGKNPAYYYNLGLAYARGRESRLAVEAFNAAIQIKPGGSTFYCSRGLAFENLQDFRSALVDYKTAMKIDPKNPYAHYLYAGLYSDPDDPTYTNPFEAVAHAEKAVKLTEYKNAQYIMGLARALRVAHNPEQAVDVARKAVELEPGREDYRRELAVYLRLKQNGFDR